MLVDLLVYFQSCFEKNVKLVLVDVRRQMSLCFLLFFNFLESLSLPFFLASPLSLLVCRCLIQRVQALSLEELLNGFLHTWLLSLLLDLKPMDHDCIFQLDCELSPVLLLLVVMHQLPTVPQLVVMGLTQSVPDNVVERRLFGVGVDENHLLLRKSIVKLDVFLSEVFYILNGDKVQRNGCFAFGISIDSIVHQERVVVDHTASAESLDYELVPVVHLMSNFYQSTLENVHLIRECIDSVQKRTFLKLSGLHRENPLVFNLSWEVFEKVHLIQAHLQEKLERVVVSVDVRFYSLIESWINLEELVIISSVDLGTCAVVPRDDCC